jgi:hypothetical protein
VVELENEARKLFFETLAVITYRASLELVLRWLLLALLLVGLLILLHGCHGNEDNELFAPLLVLRL